MNITSLIRTRHFRPNMYITSPTRTQHFRPNMSITSRTRGLSFRPSIVTNVHSVVLSVICIRQCKAMQIM
ncbi:hypothetical protein M0804_013719 [Polistes exclamans]|nr:hypothetical protein M0804_013719 [Polistes exclamans]